MAKQRESEPQAAGGSPSLSGEFARAIAIVGVNLFLVIAVFILASSERGALPDLDTRTLSIDLLPISAALGLVLACRRLDLSLPAILALAVALRSHPPDFLRVDPPVQVGILCGLCAGICLVSALVTWLGRIASVLWTGLVAICLFDVAGRLGSGVPGQWPWEGTLAASLGTLIVGAAVLGATGLVSLPSQPPIIRTGSKGLFGLLGAWIVAGVALALASQSQGPGPRTEQPFAAYTVMLAAAAMGGSYVLRGRSGAVLAVLLTCLGHLTWSFAWHARLGSPILDVLIPAGVPLLAIPLYLFLDWSVRRQTSESAPTGLLA
jgi:hypothetical protein